jgi:hypothetical protein
MPLFDRPDGAPVPDLPPVRRLIPYLMPGRNESAVYFEQILDATAMLRFLEEWNRAHQVKLTPFHLVIAALGRALHARPGLNRFVSGGRIYQRHACEISFAAKKRFRDDAPIVTLKVALPADAPLAEVRRRLGEAVGEGRSDETRAVDKEMSLALAFEGPLLRLVMRVLRWLDAWNLLPAGFIANDPLYASVFVANLGSVGIDRVWHHLYEYGTVSIFCVIGEVKKRVVPGPDGQPVVKDTLRLRYTFDERINDGFYCAASLGIVRDLLEDPARLLDGPTRALPDGADERARRAISSGL